VLPHPGGGGETYVDTLSAMEGYRFERFYLAPGPKPREALTTVWRTALSVHAAARKHDLVHVQGEVASAFCLPSLVSGPSVVTFNGLNLLRRVHGAMGVLARTNLRLVVRSASRTISVSDSERVELLQVVTPRAAARVTLIHNGVPLLPVPSSAERVAARQSLGVADGLTVAVWVGGLDPVKDPLTAINAAIDIGRDGSPFVLLVAGDGMLRTDVERVVATRGPGGVRLLGFRHDVRRVLAAADFYVLSSQREGFSFSLLEAMASGLPVVVSDAGANVEAAGDGGVVVARGDVAGFSAAFRRLVADSSEIHALGARARERVEQHFSAAGMTSRTRDVYDALLREHRNVRT
jgi:glycosyltransferase involved in cell wall biosynthesis